jgi:hypothetical protein
MTALVTAEQYAAWSGRAVTNADQMTLMLDSASEVVRDYCGWAITPNQEETLIVNGQGSPYLSLPTTKITDVSSVSVKAYWDGVNYASVELDPLTYPYDFHEFGAIEFIPTVYNDTWVFPKGVRNVAVTLTHGYEDTPGAIVGFICELVSRKLSNPGGNLTMQQVGQITLQFAQGAMPQSQWDGLEKYRVDPIR